MILNRDLSGTRGNENALKLKGLEIMPSYMYLFLFLAKGFIKESDYVMLAEATSKNINILNWKCSFLESLNQFITTKDPKKKNT